RLTEAGSDGPPGRAGITRPRACIVHVGGSRWRFRQPYGGLRCRPSVRIVVLGARGSIGGAVVRRARLAGLQVRAVVRPSSGTGGVPTRTAVGPRGPPPQESGGAGAPGPHARGPYP